VNEEDKSNGRLLLCDQSNEISLVKAVTIYVTAHGQLLAAAATTTTTTPPPSGKAGHF
jgi:hypothetical protein